MTDQLYLKTRPSSSKIWLNCTAFTNHKIRKESSVYITEGVIAHKIAEHHLHHLLVNFKNKDKDLFDGFMLDYLSLFDKGSEEYEWLINNEDKFYDEMIGYVNEYALYVLDVYKKLEEAQEVINGYGTTAIVDVEAYCESVVLGISGTCDCFIYSDGELHVFDFKYGRSIVHAKKNTQLMLYALLINRFYLDEELHEINKVVLHIFQPRASSSTWELSYADLVDFEDCVLHVTNEIRNDRTSYSMGDHCYYCPVKDECPMIRNLMENCMSKNYKLIEQVVCHKSIIKKFVQECEDIVLDDMYKEKMDYPLLKIVEGKKTRKYAEGSQDEVIKILKNNTDKNASIMKPSEPISPAQAEKLLGKKKYDELISGYVETTRRAPIIVPRNSTGEDLLRIEEDPEDIFKSLTN